MKTTIYLLAFLFTFQSCVVIAGGPHPSPHSISSPVKLAPVPPVEATFEELFETFDLSALKPAVPSEADFQENIPSTGELEKTNAPKKAECLVGEKTDTNKLTLSVPLEADFE